MHLSRTSVVLAAIMLMAAGRSVKAEDAGAWVKDAITGCEIWSTDTLQPGEGVTWAGACHDGKASGGGTLVWWDSQGLHGRYGGGNARG